MSKTRLSWSDDETAQLIELYMNGTYTNIQISEALKRSTSSINVKVKRLKDQGLLPEGRRPKPKDVISGVATVGARPVVLPNKEERRKKREIQRKMALERAYRLGV